MSQRFDTASWALILGGSSGFGLAAATRLARDGMNIALVHRDRKAHLSRIEREFDKIRATGARLVTFNADALDTANQDDIVNQLAKELAGSGRVRAVLHAVARGNLKPLVVPKQGALAALSDEDFSLTIYAMGTSIASWVGKLFIRQLFAEDARVLGLTSEGSQLAWKNYAAVSAAKATLEAIVRAMAVEYGPFGIRCNVLQPGVTDTPALRMIPGHEELIERAKARNPLGRLTTPEDVAAVIAFLCSDDARWVNGAVLRVDGGEAIVG